MKNLIIVDMQKGFINGNNSFLIERINNYLSKNTFDNVIFTKYKNSEDSPFVKILQWKGLSTVKEQKIVINKKLITSSNLLTFNKLGYGLNQKMIKKLKQLDIDEIEICGTDFDACVMAIAYNMFDNGIKPIILKNLCATSSTNQNLNYCAIEIMERQFGKNNVIDAKL